MWTDGRYFLQAERQLEEGWKMMKMDVGIPPYFEYIGTTLTAGSKLGVDPSQMPKSSYETRSKYWKEKGIEVVNVYENLVDIVWGD